MADERFRQLAAVTEADEIALIRHAAARLAEAATAWRTSPAWKTARTSPAAAELDKAVRAMTAELAELLSDAELRAVIDTVRTPLGLYAGQPDVSEALEALRTVAMHRPAATAFARQVCGLQDRRDPAPPPRPEIRVRHPTG
jgi:hypothetical protein